MQVEYEKRVDVWLVGTLMMSASSDCELPSMQTESGHSLRFWLYIIFMSADILLNGPSLVTVLNFRQRNLGKQYISCQFVLLQSEWKWRNCGVLQLTEIHWSNLTTIKNFSPTICGGRTTQPFQICWRGERLGFPSEVQPTTLLPLDKLLNWP